MYILLMRKQGGKNVYFNNHYPVIPGRTLKRFFSSFVISEYFLLGKLGLGPIKLISPPDVKVETTFFQRKFFITEPCNYPQKIAQKKNLRFLRSPYFTPFL